MVYRYKEWILYKKDVTLKGGKKQTVYFFTKRKPKSGTPCDLPNDYTVDVNKWTGLPYLKKKG